MKLWKCSTADKYFSQDIIARDEKCQRCGTTENLTCSHYWRRGHSGTRFDFDNCIALCVECHGLWEVRKNDEYMEFMLRRLGKKELGKKEYEKLERKARAFKKRSEAIEEYQYEYNRRKN